MQSFDNKTFAQVFDPTTALKDEVRAILFKWAGVEDVNVNSRGYNTNAQNWSFWKN